jgi:hypothetical protein
MRASPRKAGAAAGRGAAAALCPAPPPARAAAAPAPRRRRPAALRVLGVAQLDAPPAASPPRPATSTAPASSDLPLLAHEMVQVSSAASLSCQSKQKTANQPTNRSPTTTRY